MLPNPTESMPTATTMNYAGKDAAGLPGIPSGLVALDRITNCWKKSSLSVVAGAASMGCTSLLLAFMRNAVQEFQKQVAFFSLQLRSDKLLTKWISSEIGVAYGKIETGQLSEEEWVKLNDFVRIWEKEAGTLAHIHDAPNPTIGRLVAVCKRLKASGTELFLIDNINRIALAKKDRARFHNREQELSYIVRRLKTLAYELDAPIIVVSQLSRSGTERGRFGRPQLTDLRDSGAIENEADVVVLLYRHEYYGFSEDEEGNSTRNKAELLVAKNTFGKVATAKVYFRRESGLFKDVEEEEWEDEPQEFHSATSANESVPFPRNVIRLGSRIGGHSPLEEPPF